MTFLLYNLATNKHVQDRLHEETVKNLPEDGKLTEQSLKRMSYVKACLKESFRVHFPLPNGTERRLEEDLVLQDYLVPKGVCKRSHSVGCIFHGKPYTGSVTPYIKLIL